MQMTFIDSTLYLESKDIIIISSMRMRIVSFIVSSLL
jgi:hypothetical protein